MTRLYVLAGVVVCKGCIYLSFENASNFVRLGKL